MKIEVLGAWRRAMYDEPSAVDGSCFADDALIRLMHPMGDVTGHDGLWSAALGPLLTAMPDMERREQIVVQGVDHHGHFWVGCGCVYIGTWKAAFMGIPATRRIAHLRAHEFFRIEDGKVVEAQILWDLPELMMQAGVWPLAPSLGRDWCIPAPANQGGLGPHDAAQSQVSSDLIVDMLNTMKNHPSQGGPETMELEKFWHPKFNWYGPAGIGTGRGVEGFRRVHQIPFLKALPDRGTYPDEITFHFMAEGDFVGVTGWPDMMQTVTGSGWMGIAPSGIKVGMRSLDFWRIENGLIRENWVLVDLLHMYDQIGVDVFERMREFVNGGAEGPI
ncbi:MAG: ester cyclase [Planktomarina sp.]